LKVLTSRFGELEIDPQTVIEVPRGLIGFPDQKRYVIIQHKPRSPFYWFQALEAPDLAFVIVDPLAFKPDYQAPLSKSVLEELKAERAEEVSVYVIITIPPGHPEKMTANLLGPLVINSQTRLARQLVLDENQYSHQYPVVPPKDRPKEAGQ